MDITTAMTPPPSDQQSEYASKSMDSHGEMMCQVLMQLGRIDAKLDMIIAEDKAEDDKEKEDESESESPQMNLPMSLPPLF